MNDLQISQPAQLPTHRRKFRLTGILAATWIIAMVIVLALDIPLAGCVHDSGVASHVQHAVWPSQYSIGRFSLPTWVEVLKAAGDFRFNLAVAFLLVIARQINWRQGVFVVLAGILSGLNSLIKWIVGRYRPYHPDPRQLRPFHIEPFWHGFQGLLKQGPLSFPSGHESTAFALAAALLIVWPRGGWVFVIIAIVTGLERIAENAHYPSDVIGAIGLGAMCAIVLRSLIGRWTKPPVAC